MPVRLLSGGAQITVTIAGTAVAKGRPRITRKGFVYTPAATRKYGAYGRLAAQEAMVDRAPIAAPVKAEISVDLPVPQSWSAKRQAAALAGYIRPTTRPDVDNFVKSAMDAICGIVVADDCLVVELDAEKRYARVPQLRIVITPLPAAAAQAKNNACGDSAASDLLERASEQRLAEDETYPRPPCQRV
jgi:Holliday junction resolvase RusA-like endonuclease